MEGGDSEIRQQREELREVAEQSLNIIVDLDLDGKVRWVSPSWQDVTGTPCDSVNGKFIADLVLENERNVFADAIEHLRTGSTTSKVIHFGLAGQEGLNLEAQGIIIYDRTTGKESHTMWMIRPAVQREVTIDLPDILVDSLGDGADMLASHLTRLAEVGTLDPEHNPPPLPVLCRICERNMTPWWFPKHSELCLQEHQAEAELQQAQENLTEHRTAIVAALDALEVQAQQTTENLAEYKGMAIGVQSGSPTDKSHGPRFAVRRPLARIVELVLDLCDTALEINQPSLKESREDEIRTQSPQSEGRLSQVLQWQSPSTGIENEAGVAALCDDTTNLARAKVDAVMRFRQILEYSERIRAEYASLVQECIDAAMAKAAKINAGEMSSSDEEVEEFPKVAAESQVDAELRKSVFTYEAHSAMAQALHTAHSPLSSPGPLPSAFSTRSNSPAARRDDAEDVDSDGSVRVSMRSVTNRSPSVEQSLSRVATSRERKRTSLVLPSRARSTTREMHAPVSPLRIPKPRLPPGTLDRSPISSPTFPSSEFCSPEIPVHHRRQSSTASSDLSRAALSPRLSIANPPPRAIPPSIKDFEIIKPISKGAFGSVYLAKKRSTGDYYAIKALRKQDMVAKNQVANVKAERAILMFQGESAFVAKLYWTFPSKDYIFLVMEYLNGGDCASLVHSLGCLPEDWAKRYLAEVVQGVEHLHSREIVHRDLKPDNLLIDQRGHLKLTDFGLSRMGLIGRQKRALSKADTADPLRQTQFHRTISNGSSRSTSFDVQTYNSPSNTPSLTPAHDPVQPSYFNLKDSARSGEIEQLQAGLRRFSIQEWDDRHASPKDVFTKPEEERVATPPQVSMAMLPPPMALFDPDDKNRRFVGTPDYLAPETVKGEGQDEMSDWWSIGCILFEFLHGYPPFHASTPDDVFENILARRIDWPEETVSAEARDLVEQLLQLDPLQRLGANAENKFANGGDEIKAHPWFADIQWDNLDESQPSFVPAPENVEDTEYFDARGATAQNFAAEFDDQTTSPATTPMADFERPHDALAKVRSHVNSHVNSKRSLMPLHIPPHVRDGRTRRQSEPVAADDFGQFSFKNLPVLEKANKDVIQKLRAEAMHAQSRSAQAISATPSPSLEGSPAFGDLRRALSTSRGHRSASPSNMNASPSRASQPSSPLVQFSAGNHERRKASSSAPFPAALFANPTPQVSSPRARSQTVGSDERKDHISRHHKRRSQAIDISPSSSDTENPQQKALLRVQRRRQSSRRMSNVDSTFRTLDVLVVEDHPVSRVVMETLLSKLRCRSVIVNDSAEAIRYAASAVKFDVILTEYRLPNMNGADFARMVRETKNANSLTPIVAVTGYLKELQAPHLFDALIDKPATVAKLSLVLQKLCNWRSPLADRLPLPGSGLRKESLPAESPTSTGSYPSFPSTLSSREDSVSSVSVFSDREEWKDGGLGISAVPSIHLSRIVQKDSGDGDDEDEELGSLSLATKMLRTNSQGSVISPGGTLRASSPIKPPEIFPRRPGDGEAVDIKMEPDATPKLSQSPAHDD